MLYVLAALLDLLLWVCCGCLLVLLLVVPHG
jgi:hypothetical protein